MDWFFISLMLLGYTGFIFMLGTRYGAEDMLKEVRERHVRFFSELFEDSLICYVEHKGNNNNLIVYKPLSIEFHSRVLGLFDDD